MPPAIRVDSISKLYRLGERKAAYRTLRESLMNVAAAPYQNLRKAFTRPALPTGEERIQGDSFWALRDVSFDVQPGEVVGIIGRNGAGKSTLLKLLSRITEPTSGRIELRGRMASLLEVGTGFHPELTGRENIYLNGSILGMRQHEIARKFDEIVDFSGVEDFLETPVKRYSSGMYVRLAFAVAAHLEPEILIVDEVLAVGDAEFQKKCLGKMQDVARHGRTVLFVSHNMAAVGVLCTRAVLLNSGRIEYGGASSEVVRRYMRTATRNTSIVDLRTSARTGNGRVKLTRLTYRNPKRDDGLVRFGDPLEILVDYETETTYTNAELGLGVFDTEGRRLTWLGTRFTLPDLALNSPGGRLTCHVDSLPLLRGEYVLNLQCSQDDVVFDWIQNVAMLDVHSGTYFSSGKPYPDGWGVVALQHNWSHHKQ